MTAPSCQSCGKRATLAYNRYLRFFPYQRRIFCDQCFTQLQRREDLIFISLLFAVFFSIVGLIAILHHIGNREAEQRAQQIDAYYDINDLNQDGRVDFWEEQATDQMRRNFKAFGYPWYKVLGQQASGSRLKFLVHRPDFLELAKKEKFHNYFNFPDLMQKYLKKVTAGDSKRQLYRIFITLDNEIVFVVHEYAEIPEGGFTDAFFLPDPKPKKGKSDQPPKKEPDKVILCLEKSSTAKIEPMLGLATDEYHLEQYVLVKGPKKKKKKKK